VTVQGELDGDAQSLEYIACIEGIGWPGDIHDLTAAWQGTVIATADQAGTLATVLGCTVVGGLMPPAAFSDSIDPVTMDFSLGAVDFDVVNVGGWLDTTITPRKNTEQAGAEGTGELMVDLLYQTTTVYIQWVNPGGIVDTFDEGDVAWVGGREAILLGAKTASAPGWRYAGCTRGYVGTPRGTWDPRASWIGQRAFKIGTACYPFCQFWRGRRVAIFAHVAGEVRGNCVPVFMGRLTNMKRVGYGTVWSFGATADTFLGHRRTHESPQYVSGGSMSGRTTQTFIPLERSEESRNDGVDAYSIYYAYRYRTVPGGAALPGVTEYAPQAEIGSANWPETGEQIGATSLYLAQTLAKIGDAFIRLIAKCPDAGALVSGYGSVWWFYVSYFFIGETAEQSLLASGDTIFKPGDRVRLLLDNYLDEAGPNRFTVNGTVRYNVVDVALIWMTSCDSEFYRGDAAAGGDADEVNFTAPGWDVNQWVGYALHCVEGNNKGQARVIISNDADTIRVDSAWSSAVHVGNEYQIRNSIYDVLPWGWGLQFHNADVDIEAWEDLRDRYLASAEVGRFAVGTEPNTDYWDLITENIFRPYGIMPYVDRATGKLKPKFIFSLTVDAAFETLVAVTDTDLLPGSFESINLSPRAPVTRIRIATRKSSVIAVAPGAGKWVMAPGGGGYFTGGYHLGEVNDPTPDGDGGHVLEIVAGDAELQYDVNERSVLDVTAMLNDKDHLGAIGAMQMARLRDLVKPCYESTIYLHNRLMLQVQAGSLLSITSTKTGVRDPFTNAVGLASVPARVLSSRIIVEPEGKTLIECLVQLLDPIDSARVAPACDVTGKGSKDADEYFIVDWDKYVDNPVAYTVTDFMLFRPGDLIELRDKTGALKEGPLTVANFGSTHKADPTDAIDPWIWVLEAIASAIVAGDYLTFSPWSAASTANMELYSAYSDAVDEELGAGDPPKEYL
jgi:hypothetical protein